MSNLESFESCSPLHVNSYSPERKMSKMAEVRRSSLKELIGINELQQFYNLSSSQSVSSLLKLDFSKIDISEYPFERFIAFLCLKSKDRNPLILTVITQYLEKTDLFQKFKDDSGEKDLKTIYKILYFSSIHLEYLYLKKIVLCSI